MSKFKIVGKHSLINYGNLGEDTDYYDWCVGDIVNIDDSYGVIVYYEDGNYYGIYGYVGVPLMNLDNRYDFQLHLAWNDASNTITNFEPSLLKVEEIDDMNTALSSMNHVDSKVTNDKLSNSIIHEITFKSKSLNKIISVKGYIENFNPNGKSAFVGKNGELTLVDYNDIIQIHELKEGIL